MATATRACYNTGAISWVPAVISTTYWVSVLTVRTPNRKVSTSAAAGAIGPRRKTDNGNHLSKYSRAISELAFQPDLSGLRCSVFLIPSFLTKGERSA